MAADAARRLDRSDWVSRPVVTQQESPEHAQIKAHIGSVFDRIAPSYDQIGPKIFAYFGRRLVRAVGILEGVKILDVASGRGAVLFPAAEAVGLSGSVIGVDLSPGMVEQTTAEIKTRNIHNALVMQMDAECLDFPNNSFDVILCGFSIFFFPRPLRALGEFRRVLKSGGILGLTTFKEFFTGEWAWFSELLEAYAPVEEDMDEVNSTEEPDFQTSQGLAKILSSAGFADIHMLSETKTFYFQDEEEWWTYLWSIWMRDFLEGLEKTAGPGKVKEFQQEAYRNLEQLKTEKGIPQKFPVLITVATNT